MFAMPQELRATTVLIAVDMLAEDIGRMNVTAEERRRIDDHVQRIVHHARMLTGLAFEGIGPELTFDQRPVPEPGSNIIPFPPCR